MFQSAYGHLIKDTLSYVHSLRSFSFSHSYRQGNSVADALAKNARFCSGLTVWMEHVPPDINVLVLADKPFSKFTKTKRSGFSKKKKKSSIALTLSKLIFRLV